MEDQKSQITQKFSVNNLNKFFVAILVLSIVLGLGAGYILAKDNKTTPVTSSAVPKNPQAAQEFNQNFSDFAEGVIQSKPTPADPNSYTEGTNILVRQGAVPVYLTSSVVDLNQYIGKKVKVFGETQKALTVGWLMDVGKVQVEN